MDILILDLPGKSIFYKSFTNPVSAKTSGYPLTVTILSSKKKLLIIFINCSIT